MIEEDRAVDAEMRRLEAWARSQPDPIAADWRNRPMAGFDTETTGVDPETDRIVTACVGIGTQQGWTAKNWLIRQAEPIPEQATEVHGITTEKANAEGVEPTTALPQIRDDLYKAWEMGMPVCGFNIVYDLTILDRNLRAHSLGELEIRGPVLDPMVMARFDPRVTKGGYSLSAVAERFGVALGENAHGAEADAHATARLAWRLGGLRVFADMNLTAWQPWQAEQYKKQVEARVNRALGEGRTLADASTDWPLRPYRQEAA